MSTPELQWNVILERFHQGGTPSLLEIAEATGIPAATIYGWKQSTTSQAILASAADKVLGSCQINHPSAGSGHRPAATPLAPKVPCRFRVAVAVDSARDRLQRI